jgi:hypothetical protein
MLVTRGRAHRICAAFMAALALGACGGGGGGRSDEQREVTLLGIPEMDGLLRNDSALPTLALSIGNFLIDTAALVERESPRRRGAGRR